MRNMLALLAAAALSFAIMGWYLDWYQIRSTPSKTSGHQSLNIDINETKIIADVHKGIKKVEEKKQNLNELDPAEEANKGVENIPSLPTKQIPNP